MAAGVAKVVRALQLAAVRAFLKGCDLQAVVAATHAALRGRGFSLGNGHDFSCILKNCVTNRLPGFVVPVAGNDWPARRAVAPSRPDDAGKIFCRKVPQRQMVSGAGSGAAIAFLPAKPSPLRAVRSAEHTSELQTLMRTS